jgi:hypothetical protein
MDHPPGPFPSHYTVTSHLSRQAKEVCGTGSGMIKLGRRGVIWLTPTLYALGQEAANRLGIVGKPVEMEVEIPVSMLTNPTVLSIVRAVVQQNQIIRQGLGWEFTVQHTINIAGLRWFALAWP